MVWVVSTVFFRKVECNACQEKKQILSYYFEVIVENSRIRCKFAKKKTMGSLAKDFDLVAVDTGRIVISMF